MRSQVANPFSSKLITAFAVMMDHIFLFTSLKFCDGERGVEWTVENKNVTTHPKRHGKGGKVRRGKEKNKKNKAARVGGAFERAPLVAVVHDRLHLAFPLRCDRPGRGTQRSGSYAKGDIHAAAAAAAAARSHDTKKRPACLDVPSHLTPLRLQDDAGTIRDRVVRGILLGQAGWNGEESQGGKEKAAWNGMCFFFVQHFDRLEHATPIYLRTQSITCTAHYGKQTD